MEIDLSGRKALVGGSSSGIGAAIAVELARCGASVVLMARNESKLQSVLANLDATKGQVHSYLITDFMDYDFHKSVLQDFFETNEIDILVNNTNGPAAGDVTTRGELDYQVAFNLLFQNAVIATNLALPFMKQNGFGRIINVGSMTIKEPQDSLVLSNTMRTALTSWSKSLSNAVAVDGITVNTILTGYFDTDRLNSLMQAQAEREGISFEEVKHSRVVSVPMKRLGEAKEYGYLVAFLASNFASFLTGAAIPLDGGIAKTLF